ncbi:MAG: hypothetical protein A2Y38_05625 [Spirochaetes bacterium GWB1_59_5]|nr:MAG: hypothetical protein A2Y38_05625 [Spirochaetes bacterium GWB1_59_5]
MTYATQQNMIDRFGLQELIELTDRENTGALDANVLAQALVDADAEINAYLSGRYTLPLTSVPPTLAKFAADIARYQLYDTRATDMIKARYDDAIKFFKLLANGSVSLGLNLVNQPVANVGGVQTNAAVRVFDASTLSDY